MSRVTTERETLDWMRVHGRPRPTMDFQLIMVTPDLARQMLGANNGNRRLRKNSVESMAKAMRRGEWKISHQAIALGQTGRLIDGQHRLSAVVAAETAVPMVVAYGADERTFDSLDIGVKRTAEDIIGGNRQILQVSALLCRLLYTDNDNSIQRIEQMHDIVSPLTTTVCGGVTKLNRVNSVGIRTGVVIRAMRGHQRYITDLWRALVEQMTEALPPIGHAFLRRINQPIQRRGSHQHEAVNLCMGWEVANEDRRQVTKFNLPSTPKTINEIREVVRAYMEANPVDGPHTVLANNTESQPQTD